MRKLSWILLFFPLALLAADMQVKYTGAATAETVTPFEKRAVSGGTNYDSALTVFVKSTTPGALLGLEIAQFDAGGKEIARAAASTYRQHVNAEGMERKGIYRKSPKFSTRKACE